MHNLKNNNRFHGQNMKSSFEKTNDNDAGFSIILATFLVLAIGMVIVLSTGYIGLNDIKIARNNAYSVKAYYAAEAGIEDGLLRMRKGMNFSENNSLTVGDGNATIEISEPIGGARTITSNGEKSGRFRRVRVVYTITTDSVSFYYGVQVGEGGMEMGNNARVKGNVFSNGSIIAPAGRGYIDNSVVVASSGNKIKGMFIGKDAAVHTCEDSAIAGNLTYVSGGSLINCNAAGTVKSQPNQIDPAQMPLSLGLIGKWKQEAATGGIIPTDITYDAISTSLGPIQIGTSTEPKNLIVTNNTQLKITGTIYVTGNIIFDNNSIIELDKDAYGSFSGIIIADGRITTKNNATLRGTGEASSYVLILSTNNSLSEASPAISISNNAAGAIFYTTSGMVFLNNNMKAREVTAYKVKINNNAEIQYESGLENSIFSSGPGGSWKVTEWREIE